MIIISKENSGIEIPKKCRECPVQCENFKKLVMLLVQKETGNSVGASLLADKSELLDEMTADHLSNAITEEMITELRQHVGDKLDDIDRAIDNAKEEITANTLACSGFLKMRASKGDVTYTVAVCTSPREYTRDTSGYEHLPAHISATSREA